MSQNQTQSSSASAATAATTGKLLPKLSSNAIQPLSLEGNLSRNWENWYQNYKILMRASGLENEESSRKVAIFLHYIGTDALTIFNSFNMDMDNCSYNDLITKFCSHCKPKTNLTVERHNFLTRSQKPDETIDEFVTALKNLSLTCELDTLRETLVRDMFIVGLNSSNRMIKEKLLQEDELTLEKAIKIAKSIEITHVQAQQLNKNSEVVVCKIEKRQNRSSTQKYGQSAAVRVQSSHSQKASPGINRGVNVSRGQYVNQSNNNVRGQSNSNKQACTRCGQIHRQKCPAQGVTCNNCNKVGHFAKCCFNRQVKTVNVEQNQNMSSSDENLFMIRSINEVNSSSKLWTLDVKINNKILHCNLDTGAETNVMSIETFNDLNIKNISPAFVKLTSFSGNNIPVAGKSVINCTLPDNVSVPVEFIIANIGCQTIIGLPTCEKLGLIKRIFSMNNQTLLNQYDDVFKGLGCLPGECHISIDTDVTPVVDPPRKVPFMLHDRLKNELDRMIALNVIVKVNEPSAWVNSIVIVEKKNKSLRICLDPRNLNKAIKRCHYPLPTVEEIRSKLANANYFSTLDAQSGFWMIKLDESSSKLCTFGTPFGRFRFLRLPYGISCAPEMFHKIMTELFADIKGVLIYLDDILIFSDTLEGHNEILKEVLERARQVNLKFNKEKCHFLLNEVQYLGHIFSSTGMRPDPKKIDAICQLKAPENVKELKRFLGMVNYLGAYIDNLSERTTRLRLLLKKNTAFHWDEAHQAEFESLKQVICNTPVLTYFNPKNSLTLSVDSSKFAVGAVILQNKKPIAFSSKSLTDSQSRYAQIEKELYAIQYGCSRFHQYIYGRTVQVETDHKPLVTLFKKPLSEVPTRLQRMMLNLQQYDLNVTYTPGKYLFIADTLSRAPVEPPDDDTILDEELRIHMNLLISNLAVTAERLNEIKLATQNDSDLQMLISYCNDDWPCSKNNVKSSLKPYFNIRHDIHTIDGLIFKGQQLIIPTKLRSKILDIIHEGHLGIERCQRQARSVVYWPNISVDIKNKIEQCTSCLKYRNSNQTEPLLPHEPATLPWNKVGIDFFYYKNLTYLLIVDYFSKYFEIVPITSNNAKTVIESLKSIFARHGIPLLIVSDNGPPFNSEGFKQFLNDWHISHHTSSPHYPQSNGLVERMVQTIKNIFNKCEAGSDPYIALLQYRNTPQASGYSPAQLLMSRYLRTKLPVTEDVLKPKVIDYDKYNKFMKEGVERVKEYHDQHAKFLPNLNIGDDVYFKKTPDSSWSPASVVQIGPFPRSFVVRTPEGDYRRNRRHLMKPNVIQKSLPTNNQITPPRARSPSPVLISDDHVPNRGVFTRSGRQVVRPRRFSFTETDEVT